VPPLGDTVSVAVMERRTLQRLFLACWLAILARIFLIVSLITTPVALISYGMWELLYVVQLGILVVVLVVYIGLAFVLRCPNCSKRLLVELMGPKHPAARKAKRLDYWGTIVWSVVRHQEFTCMHCGVSYRQG
jgi:hypothetical protein